MPQLSVIVPVYNVEAFLAECLDSIVLQAADDVEIIAVDDASTDDSPAILRRYAEADARIRLLTHHQNQGLGAARNTGLEAATGDYVLFVDSDDWLADGALAAIAQRLSATSPDVLIFDYARVQWQGDARRNAIAEAFQVAGPEVFDLRQRPDVLDLLWVVWTKAYRRAFIEDLGLRFHEGYYEDVSWTFPCLMAAERITLLNRLCYYYRRRGTGAITATSSRKHFDILPHYGHLFGFLDAHPDLDAWRPVMHRQMATHLLYVLNQGGVRIPLEHRREFFKEASAALRRFLPPAGRASTGIRHQELELLLMRYDRYLVFEALSRLKRVYKRVRRAARAGGLARKVVRRVATRVWRMPYRALRQLPLDPGLAVFDAYWFSAYSCNPRAVYEKMRELAPHLRGVWVVNRDARERIPPGVPAVVAGTLAYYRVMARAKFLVTNVNFPNDIVKRRGQVHLQTQHGTPLKKMGLDLRDFPTAAKNMSFDALMRRVGRWDFNLSQNRFSTSVWNRCYPAAYTTLEYGYPRNDVLVNATEAERRAARTALGIDDPKTVVLYAPTFRDHQPSFQLGLDLQRFCTAIGDGYVVLVRAHYFYSSSDDLRRLQAQGTVIDVSSHPDVQQLCIAADVLITDYSSIQFDYANLARPIVIYADDWHAYQVLRGVNFDLLAEPPGAVATTEDDLIRVFAENAHDTPATREQLRRYRHRFCEFDDGSAAERTVRHVFLGQPVAAPIPLVQREAEAGRPRGIDGQASVQTG